MSVTHPLWVRQKVMNEVTVKNDRKNNLTRNLQADSKETSRDWQVQDGAVFPTTFIHH